jgi:hypothetical protein
MKLYRAMIDDGEGRPLVVPTARGLGVRFVSDDPELSDILADDEGLVGPGDGGMSVCPETPEYLVLHRRPPSYGGTGKDPVWEIADEELGEGLMYRQDTDADAPRPHGLVEPDRRMRLDEYEDLLAATREAWRRVD